MTQEIRQVTEPHQFESRVLVCVTGLSPQVVTETVYALLHQRPDAFVPTEVHVITTRTGRALVIDKLLAPAGGHWHRLQREQPALAATRFDEDHVHTIAKDGVLLDDIVTPEDSGAAANSILALAARLARDRHCAIHASIAGGRKSMGFLLGSVMTLVGRPQDRLSHVLVTPAFESLPDFYFPPRDPINLTARDGTLLSTADARVKLALIPIVTLADGLRQQVDGGRSYDELVQRRQLELAPLVVVLRPGRRELVVNGVSTTLPATECAWYHYFALLRQRAGPPLVQRAADTGLVYFPKNQSGAQALDADLLSRAFQRVPDAARIKPAALDQDSLRSKLSEMRTRLEAALGPEGAKRVAVLGPGDFGRRDSRYGLNFDPRILTIE